MTGSIGFVVVDGASRASRSNRDSAVDLTVSSAKPLPSTRLPEDSTGNGDSILGLSVAGLKKVNVEKIEERLDLAQHLADGDLPEHLLSPGGSDDRKSFSYEHASAVASNWNQEILDVLAHASCNFDSVRSVLETRLTDIYDSLSHSLDRVICGDDPGETLDRKAYVEVLKELRMNYSALRKLEQETLLAIENNPDLFGGQGFQAAMMRLYSAHNRMSELLNGGNNLGRGPETAERDMLSTSEPECIDEGLPGSFSPQQRALMARSLLTLASSIVELPEIPIVDNRGFYPVEFLRDILDDGVVSLYGNLTALIAIISPLRPEISEAIPDPYTIDILRLAGALLEQVRLKRIGVGISFDPAGRPGYIPPNMLEEC